MSDDQATMYELPELMRGLRAFGAAHALPGSDHDRFFAPLVTPIRALRAEHARLSAAGSAPWRAAEAIDGTRAGAELRATLVAFATDRFPESAPDRRALAAELTDEAEPLFDALDALVTASQRLHAAGDVEREAAWRAWTGALTAALVAADACWTRSLPALCDSRGAEGRMWRKAIRRTP